MALLRGRFTLVLLALVLLQSLSAAAGRDPGKVEAPAVDNEVLVEPPGEAVAPLGTDGVTVSPTPGAGRYFVFAQDPGPLRSFLTSHKLSGLVGSAPSERAPFTISVLELDASTAERLKDVEGVAAVIPYAEPVLSGNVRQDPAPDIEFAGLRHHVDDAWLKNYKGNGVNVAIIDTGVDFANMNLQGTQARFDVSQVPASILAQKPYLANYDGWPVAFDPKSMAAYLDQGYAEGTWYANTTANGTGDPGNLFTDLHFIKVDGKNDFGKVERWGGDVPGDSTFAVPGGGFSNDFDLERLYVTRDLERWYLGFDTNDGAVNKTYVAYIDVDNATSGGTYDPLGKLVDTDASHAHDINDIAYSPNGSWVATASTDRRVKVWASDGSLVYNMGQHEAVVRSVAWSPNGLTLASADSTKVILWDATDGSMLAQIPYPDGSATNGVLDFSPNGTFLAVGGMDSTFYTYIIDVPSMALFGYFLNPANSPTRALAFSPAGPYAGMLAIGLQSGTAYVIDMNATNLFDPSETLPTKAFPLFTLAEHTTRINSTAWSPSGALLITGSQDFVAKVWDVATETRLQNLAHAKPVTAVAWSGGGTRIATGDDSGIVQIWSDTYANLGSLTARRAIGGLSWGNGENTIATGDGYGRATVWQAVPAATTLIFRQHLPDYALYLNYTSVDWTVDPQGEVESFNNTFRVEEASFYRWNASASLWENSTLGDAGIQVAYDSTVVGGAVDQGFVEFSFARGLIGDPPGIAVELFTTGANVSHAQDTSPADGNVEFPDTDWSTLKTSLRGFEYRDIQTYKIALPPGEESKSIPAAYHFGSHPGENLLEEFGSVGVLVVDSVTAGVYDKVWVDLNNDKRFDASDPVLSKGSEIAALDNYNSEAVFMGDLANASTPDGYPDVSGGMIYFIADGATPLPYSDVYIARNSLQDVEPTPANGELVAFVGEFVPGRDHGTLMASAVAGQGVVPISFADPALGDVTGIAPNAKLIPVGNSLANPFEAWYFATEGYDGTVGTGDEAQVGLNGFNYPTNYEAGWDAFSLFPDWVTAVHSGGQTTFVASAGNDGFGYGTVSSPASGASIIAVGAATDNQRDASTKGGPEGPNDQFGDVEPYSSRGPAATGVPKPEVIATGSAYLDLPLGPLGDGTNATTNTPFAGSSVSAAVTAGVLALIFDAYATVNSGSFPLVDEARELLMSGADDTGEDPFTQGAGFVNASASVDLADGTGGISVSPSVWVPGDFRGLEAEAFARLLSPGASDAGSFLVDNHGSTTESVSARAVVYKRTDLYTWTNDSTVTLLDGESGTTFWLNASGMHRLNPFITPPPEGTIETLHAWTQAYWDSIDLVRVVAYAEMEEVDANDDLFIEDGDYYSTLTAYDWDGSPWFVFPAPAAFPEEFNTMAQTLNAANIQEVRIHDPAARVHQALTFRLAPSTPLDGLSWTIRVEVYEKQDWAWATLYQSDGATPLPPSFTVNPGSNYTFVTEVTPPGGTAAGTYEAAIELTTSSQTTIVPVAVNIGVTGAKADLGGPALDELYEPHRFMGGFGGGFGASQTKSSDWRYLFLDIPDQGMFAVPASADFKFYFDFGWSAYPSDIGVYVFGPGAVSGPKVGYIQSRYGPYRLESKGSSEDLPEFNTTTRGNREILTALFTGGLNLLAFRNNALNGSQHWENLSGEVGWIRLNPVEANVPTNSLVGETELSWVSNVNFGGGIVAEAVGPADMEREEDIEIAYDREVVQEFLEAPSGATFIVALSEGSYTKVLQVENAVILDIHIIGHSDSPDLDLGLFLDANGDEEAQPDEFVVYDADSDADEHIKWNNPEDGQYLIKVLGFDTRDPGHFDLEIAITIAGVAGYSLRDVPEGVIPPYTLVRFNMTWDFTGDTLDRDYGGAITFGPPAAPKAILIPVTVGLDREAPSVTDFVVTSRPGFVIANATEKRLNDPMPSILISVADPVRGELDFDSVELWINGEDVTPQASVAIPFGNNPDEKLGYWSGDVTFTPQGELEDGTYVVVFRVGDLAGNIAEAQFLFVIDEEAPVVALDGPPLEFTTTSSVTLSGVTDPAATVLVPGGGASPDAAGRFQFTAPLVAGENEIVVRAVDWFGADPTGNPIQGNVASATKTVIYDATPPRFDALQLRSSDPTPLDSVELTGFVTDEIATGVAYDPTTIQLTVAGSPVSVRPDGSFTTFVELGEGQNFIDVRATDLAGNTANETRFVTRDSAPPMLSVESVPETVTSGSLTLRGSVSDVATVTVNGNIVLAPNGSFETELALTPGLNVFVLRAVDAAGNPTEMKFAVDYVAPAGVASYLAYVLIVVMLILGLLMGYFVGMRAVGAGPPEGVPAEEEPAEELEGPAEGIAEEELAPEEDERVAKLREAYESDRISQEVYEENLARLGASVPATVDEEPQAVEEEIIEEEPEEAPPEEDERVAKLREAYDAGRISQEVYEENLGRLGVAAPAVEEAVEEEPPEEAEIVPEDARVAKLREAYESGRVTREVYEENLSRLGVAVPEAVEEAEEPLEAVGETVGEELEEAAEPAGEVVGEAVPGEDERVAKLREAHEAGRISDDVYRENLARLGVEPEPSADMTQLTKLAQAFAEGRLSAEPFARNIEKMDLPEGVEMVEKIRRMVGAYTQGKVGEDVLRENVKRVLEG